MHSSSHISKLLDKRLGLLINFKVPQVMQGVKRVVNNF